MRSRSRFSFHILSSHGFCGQLTLLYSRQYWLHDDHPAELLCTQLQPPAFSVNFHDRRSVFQLLQAFYSSFQVLRERNVEGVTMKEKRDELFEVQVANKVFVEDCDSLE